MTVVITQSVAGHSQSIVSGSAHAVQSISESSSSLFGSFFGRRVIVISSGGQLASYISDQRLTFFLIGATASIAARALSFYIVGKLERWFRRE
jgi:hypothetical protein